MNNKKKLVLFGLGKQGEEHLIAAQQHPHVEIIAVIEQQNIAHKYPDFKIDYSRTLQEFAAKKIEFDGFILALPHDAYKPIWKNILQYKKPILKEKPLGRNYREAQEFMDDAKHSGNGLMTAIQRRTHPSYAGLKQYIKEQKLMIDEVHAHLHLGKSTNPQHNKTQNNWRNDRQKTGGGALLDAGYHMIDLLIFLLDDFDIVAASMWNNEKLDDGVDNEDRSWVIGRSQQTWIFLDIWVGGDKSEGLILKSGENILTANRQGYSYNNQLIANCEKQWQQAMAEQLSNFAHNIEHHHWDDNVIWDQLPTMQKIDQAYNLSNQY